MTTDIAREVAIIRYVRSLRKGRLPKDGDGDGFYSPGPGMPDKTPVPPGMRRVNRALKTGVSATKPAKPPAKPKPPAKKLTRPVDNTTGMPSVINPEVDEQNPLFAPIWRPIQPDGAADYQRFKIWHHLRAKDNAIVAGGRTHFRRFVPKGHKPGKIENPKGEYYAGGGMGTNEPGWMGEILMTQNPTLKKLISDYFGAPLGESEGMSLTHGRAANSLFDAYAGGYGVEMKTLAVTGSLDKFKVGSDKHPWSRKVALAKKRKIKPAVVFLMVDQRHGRVWLFAAKDKEVAPSGNFSYSTMTMLTPGEGLPLGQDAMYSAWLYGTIDVPLREGGDGDTVQGDGKSVVITGTPSSTKKGNEAAQSGGPAVMLDAPATGEFR